MISFKRGKMIVPNRMPKMNVSSLRKGVNREMKKILVLIVAALMALGFSLPALANGPIATANLITDGGDNPTDIGDLTVTYASGVFTVAYSIDSPWEIVETHVYIGSTAPAKSAPGRFPYVAGDIPFAGTGTVYMAAHAEVRRQTGVDEFLNPIYMYETVWAQTGVDHPIGKGKNWATYFEFTLD